LSKKLLDIKQTAVFFGLVNVYYKRRPQTWKIAGSNMSMNVMFLEKKNDMAMPTMR